MVAIMGNQQSSFIGSRLYALLEVGVVEAEVELIWNIFSFADAPKGDDDRRVATINRIFPPVRQRLSVDAEDSSRIGPRTSSQMFTYGHA